MASVIQKFRNFLGGRAFSLAIMVMFTLQSLWIAVSAAYPQAFDEDFHFGLIKIYSHHGLPFLSGQPVGGNQFGAVARDPSFLYHYLMSFPLRIFQYLTDNQAIQIIGLRVIDIVLFGIGLLLFRRLLLRVGLSGRQTNMSLFVLVLIPIVPQLAGQINYDNLLMPLTAWAMLVTVGMIEGLRRHELSLLSVIKLLTICLTATMVKYEFLPIFGSIVLFLAFDYWRLHRGNSFDVKQLLAGFMQLSLAKKILLPIVFALVFGMFVQRDVINVVRYHNVAPDCGYVLSVEECSAYPVWYHDYISHQQVAGHSVSVSSNPVWYLCEWTYWLWYRLFFAINGPLQGFTNYPPLVLPAAGFMAIVIGSLVALLVNRGRLLRNNPALLFLGLTVVLFLLALLSQGFLKYRHTAVLELMNGRYLLPILLPAAAIGCTAIHRCFRDRPRLQAGLAALIIVCFLQGGGILTFISRSDASWYWDNRSIRTVNETAQRFVHPLLWEGSKTYTSRKWFFN